MRKPHLLFPLILTMFWSTTCHAWWFWNNSSDNDDADDARDQQIQQLQAQVVQENHTNGQMVVAVIILSTGVVVALVIGAAIGSKARKAAKGVKR